MMDRYGTPLLAHAETADALPSLSCSRNLEHGDRLELDKSPDGQDGWTLSVYHVPGHAPGHLAFKESRYDALIVGDLVSTLSSILIDTKDGHLATYLHSLALLETITGGALYPGHGPPSLDSRGLVQKQIAHRKQREVQLLEALGSVPLTPDDLVRRVYADLPEALHPLAKRSLMSGLVKLSEEGRIEQSDSGFRLA